MPPLRLADLDVVPRLGWVNEPSPLMELPELAAELGVGSVLVKRDDALTALVGGSKARKLDYLLATEPFATAPRWAALGAMGSGNLVALCEAAERLDRELEAHLFWEPLDPAIIDNLAFIASSRAEIHVHSGRFGAALRHPALATQGRRGGAWALPPGSTTAVSMVGGVRAALELASQLEHQDLLPPQRLFVALGTGGLAVGLALGLALAELDVEVVAVAAVERILSTRRRLDRLAAALARAIDRHGLSGTEGLGRLRLRIERGQLGPGYGQPSPATARTIARFAAQGLPLEPVYTAKAAAALLASPVDRSLLWHSDHHRPLPHRRDWREQLPLALRDRLRRGGAKRLRRRTVVMGAALAAIAAAATRLGGYAEAEHLTVLSGGQAQLMLAAAEVLVPQASAAERAAMVPAIDRYLQAMPESTLNELDAALLIIEHLTPLAGEWPRFTDLTVQGRREVIETLAARDDLLEQCYLALRELCMLAYYQLPTSWEAIGYAGPRMPPARPRGDPQRIAWPRYDSLIASPDDRPEAMVS